MKDLESLCISERVAAKTGKDAGDGKVKESAINTSSNLDSSSQLQSKVKEIDAFFRLAKFCAEHLEEEAQPLCEACSKTHYDSLALRLAEEKRNQKRYQDFCADLSLVSGKKMATRVEKGDIKREDDDAERIRQMKQSIRDLESRLGDTSKHRREVNDERARLSGEIEQLEYDAGTCWDKLRNHRLVMAQLTQRIESLDMRRLALTDKLECLKRTNVFNDAFFIWFDGPFGTINGFRLGRLPSQPVEYSEINAAWGQAAMLLATIEKRHKGFKFQRFRVVPMGSYSKLGPHGNLSRPLPLYWDGGWRKGPFNRAMVAILSCLDELGIYATAYDRTIHMPYSIKGNTIGGHSIELGDWYKWTCALKYFLTNLKWLVAWSSKQPD